MWKLKKYLYITSVMAVLLCCSCRREVIIPKDKMSEIIAELYMADQYISVYHKFSAQRDSSRLFAAIIDEYGYTADDYRRSTSYYLERKDSYKNIVAAAKERLVERQRMLKEKINTDNFEQVLLSDTSKLKEISMVKGIVELKKRFGTPVSATDTIPSDSTTLWSFCFPTSDEFSFVGELEKQKDSVKTVATDAKTASDAMVKAKLDPKDPSIITTENEMEVMTDEKEIK